MNINRQNIRNTLKGHIMNNKIYVIGHKNPDTDSVCSAIAYAALKNKLTRSYIYEPRIAGNINPETEFVLNYFNVTEPALIDSVGTQVSDLKYRLTPGVSSHISLQKAWGLMKEWDVATLPITDGFKKLTGIIGIDDIAYSYMDDIDNYALGRARTPYKNIKETINGTIITGNEHAYFTKGKVLVLSGNQDTMREIIMPDDIVLLGDVYENQMLALENKAACIIVCSETDIHPDVIEKAKATESILMTTPHGSFTTARLINQSIPISFLMKKDDLITFEPEDYLCDVQKTMSQVRFRDFPIIGPNNEYVGMMSRRNLMNAGKKQLILVDHNEKNQAVDGIDEAEVLEIIDHHRIGSLETASPALFRNQPLGCTCTIISLMYQEAGITPEKDIAGLMLSAILSDTLMFKSPTCTATDRAQAEKLAKIASVDITGYASSLFEAASNFKNKSLEEVFFTDFKIFDNIDESFGVSQISSVSDKQLLALAPKLMAFMPSALSAKGLAKGYCMLTDILTETTYLICVGTDTLTDTKLLFPLSEINEDGLLVLHGMVSRKKQLIPVLLSHKSIPPL